MTKQTKTIEDYPELQFKLAKFVETTCDATGVKSFHYLFLEDVVRLLLEQQAKIDSLTEQNKELEDACSVWKEKAIAEHKQNKELQGSVRVLEVMLKPDGYTTDEEHYHTPEDYVDSCLTVDSKVGEQFTITPYTLLPEETYEITKLDDSTFEIELVELNKESK